MTPQPEFVTFTGIDDRTDLTAADELARQYPIEWGVLFTQSNRDARFPCAQAVAEILEIRGAKAAHLCGAVSTAFQGGDAPEGVPLSRFNRVQVNGHRINQTMFPSWRARLQVDLIVQTRQAHFTADGEYLELYDRSGGEGVLPAEVPALPAGGPLVGFAGGIGPDTVGHYLSLIGGAGRFWLDMEGRIRTNGWFDLEKARRVCGALFG